MQAAPLAGETVPEVLPPPQPALLDWATLTPAADSHLAPCPHCGAPNGLSASSCWNCEGSLSVREPVWRSPAPPQAALAPTRVPADADESLPVLTLAVKSDDATTELPAAAVQAPVPLPQPAAEGRRYAGVIGASIFVVAVAAMGAALYFDTPAPAGAAKSGGGFISPPEPAALATARPAPTPTAGLAGASNARPAVAEMPRTAALRALAVEPDAPAAVPSPPSVAIEVPAGGNAALPLAPAPAPAVVKAVPAGKARNPSRPAREATALALPKRNAADSYPTWQAPVPARPCNPTIATLGLCAGSAIAPAAPPAAPIAPTAPTQSKE